MRVTAAEDEWEEADIRHRQWCTAKDAQELIDRDGVLDLLAAAIEQLKQQDV